MLKWLRVECGKFFLPALSIPRSTSGDQWPPWISMAGLAAATAAELWSGGCLAGLLSVMAMPSHMSALRRSKSKSIVQEEPVRLWAVSDIHTDSKENMSWVETLSDSKYLNDVLVVAGDISSNMILLETTLRVLVSKFSIVFFTPGNHDLWLEGDYEDSLRKLSEIRRMCARIGVFTDAAKIGSTSKGHGQVWVCPLLSWHHQSFDTEPDLQGWDLPPVERVAADYDRCRFPRSLSMFDESVAKTVDAMNDREAARAALAGRKAGEPLVTFSHFLPRIELLLEKRFLAVPQLPKMAGSRFLGERVQAMQPDVHIFGHTHFGWDAVHDGVRYIQAALAYPGERTNRWHTLAVGEFGPEGPLLIWSSDTGFAPRAKCRWSNYYEHHPREPERVFELATYAAQYFRKTDSRAVEVTPDFSHEKKEIDSEEQQDSGLLKT